MNLFSRAALCCALALPLAACGSAGDLTTAKTIDTICSVEPSLYAAYVTFAVTRGASEKKLATAAAAHAVVTDTCANPPTDLVRAAAVLATAYATIVSARASVERGV